MKLDGLTGKTIKEAEVDGFGIRMVFTDGAVFDYDASDGGYSQYELTEATADAMQKQIDHVAESDKKVSISCAHENDLIFRKAAIDAVVDEFKRSPTPAIRAKLRLEALPPAQPEQRWIPSGERPPEEGSYLVWMPFAPPEERIAVAYYCDGYWNIKTPISAWMPLPEPYWGGEKE